MTLYEFIDAKPKALRLGQWFVNCYFKRADKESLAFYQKDGTDAMRWIYNFIERNQWDEDNMPAFVNKQQHQELKLDNTILLNIIQGLLSIIDKSSLITDEDVKALERIKEAEDLFK